MIDFTDFSKQGIKVILTAWALFALGIFACEKATVELKVNSNSVVIVFKVLIMSSNFL